MTQSKKTQERLPNRRNEINTFSVLRSSIFWTWLFSLTLSLSLSSLPDLNVFVYMCKCVSMSMWVVQAMWFFFLVCLFVRFTTIVLQRQKWTHRLGVFQPCTIVVVVGVWFFLFWSSFLRFLGYPSQFSPIYAGWCLYDGNGAYTHSFDREREKNKKTKKNQEVK